MLCKSSFLAGSQSLFLSSASSCGLLLWAVGPATVQSSEPLQLHSALPCSSGMSGALTQSLMVLPEGWKLLPWATWCWEVTFCHGGGKGEATGPVSSHATEWRAERCSAVLLLLLGGPAHSPVPKCAVGLGQPRGTLKANWACCCAPL